MTTREMTKQRKPKKSDLKVVQSLTSQKAYEEQFRADTLQVYKQWRTDAAIPASAIEDSIEQAISEGCSASLNATETQYEDQVSSADKRQTDLAIDPTEPQRIVNTFKHRAEDSYDTKKADNEALFVEAEQVQSDIKLKDTADKIGREPKPTTTSKVTAQALPFAGAEALFGVFGLAGALSMSEAMMASLALAVVNVFLAGYVGGKILFPLCLKVNTGNIRYLAWLVLSCLTTLVIGANLKAWELRVKLGADPESPTFESDFLISNMVGFFLFLVGIALAGYWAYRFCTSQDLNRAYGILGDKRTKLQKALKVPAEECRADIINKADKAEVVLQKVREAGAQALIQSEASHMGADNAAGRYESAQDALITVYTGVIGLARIDGRQILEDQTPAYFGTPPDLTGLRKPPISTVILGARFNRLEAQHNALTAELAVAETEIADVVSDLRARIKKEFGA